MSVIANGTNVGVAAYQLIALVTCVVGSEAQETESGADYDRFGVAQLHPSISGGREWFAKWDRGDPRVLHSGERDPEDDELIARGDGIVEINGEGIAVLKGAAPRMYVYDEARKKKWLNTEVTFYGCRGTENKEEISYRGFVAGTRSEHQDATDVASGDGRGPDKGSTYYAKMLYDGRVVFQKEVLHFPTGYSENKPDNRKVAGWGTPDESMPPDVWIGYKFVCRTEHEGRHVKLELYRDMTDGRAGGKWEKLIEFDDVGGWTSPGLTEEIFERLCPDPARTRDGILLKPGTSVFIRNDGIDAARYKWFTIREVASLP